MFEQHCLLVSSLPQVSVITISQVIIFVILNILIGQRDGGSAKQKVRRSYRVHILDIKGTVG